MATGTETEVAILIGIFTLLALLVKLSSSKSFSFSGFLHHHMTKSLKHVGLQKCDKLVGKVKSLHLYPVKSARAVIDNESGEKEFDKLTVGQFGFEGDRVMMVVGRRNVGCK